MLRPRPPAPGALERAALRLVRRRSTVRRTPSLIQMENVECGAAALGILLRHHGRWVTLEDLRIACGVSRDGSNARNIVEAAHGYGLTGGGRTMEIPDLVQLNRPVIVFWAFQHFLVVNGFERRGRRVVVRLNDPASGPRTMTLREFDEGFTGVVLDLVPGPQFRPQGHPERLTAQLSARMTATGRGLALALAASVVLVLPGLVTPLFSQYFIDTVYGNPDPWTVLPLLLGMLLAAVAVVVLTLVQCRYLRLVETRVTLTTSTRFVHHLLRLPIRFFLQRRAAELARRVGSNALVSQVLTRDLVVIVVNLLLIAVYGTALLLQDALLGLLAMAVALLNLVALRAVMRRRLDSSTALQAEEGRLAAATLQTLAGITTVKSAGTEHAAFVRWSGFMARVITESQRLGVPTALITIVPPMLATVDTALVITVGGLRVADGVISVGLLFAFQAMLAAFTRPMTLLTNQAGRLQAMGASLARLRDAEDYQVDDVFDGREREVGRISGRLVFEEVGFSFGQSAGEWIRGLSFTVDPGMRVALVGASGSGKSTVGRLAAGLLEPTSGRILLDGAPRAAWSRQSLASAVAYVDQSVTLFEGSVRDNVCLWDDDIADDAVVRALADAELLDEVSQRAGGANAAVLEGGKNFSGGQRQRLEIARALVSGPALVVLDEATSALDPVTEHALMDNLRRRGCALLVIAHRLSTVRDADRILVMDGGRVVEEGTHTQLVERDGCYRRLIESGRRQEAVA